MCVCDECGKLIEKKFYYCPWCGHSRIQKNSKSERELRVAKYTEMQKELHQRKIEKMQDELSSLENELSAMVVCAQLAR